MIMTLSVFGTKKSGRNGYLLVSTPAMWTGEADVAWPTGTPFRVKLMWHGQEVTFPGAGHEVQRARTMSDHICCR
jgi:hypothetical protein